MVLSAMPVTMPGRAIGRTSANEMRVAAEEAEAMNGQRSERAQDQREQRRADGPT